MKSSLRDFAKTQTKCAKCKRGRVIIIKSTVTTPLQDEELEMYAIIVYGMVPEFMPHRAFRRDKHYKKAGTKAIKCPFCRETLTIVEATAKLELIRYSHKVKTKVKCHKSMPCGKCHKTVGIIYQAA